MWIYKKTDTKMWTVGYYKPDGDWRPESDHNKKVCAAKRVSFLNGGRSFIRRRCICGGF